ncbi:restriction endonuclease [Bacillus cereus group sp. TH253LC]|uniref:restriction endonuclease n=1 Tax=Bacillus cereus group sp. TH253LC TaxID=3018043 RepID=UPI0022E868E5|nr:restriction endonuclease [Bacillus cereus group sp. TH253LC]MDA1547932.1 restriction endonuclease [Bacillus cereus group sp. TH253LC]
MMNLETFSDLQNLVAQMDAPEFDDIFWKPIDNPEDLKEFDEHIQQIEESKNWPRELNWKKGGVLEDFTMFLFKRFQDVEVSKNKRPGDNETDIETKLSEKVLPPFMIQCIGPKIICECKNYKTKSVDVGMVTKLAEILPDRKSSFGIFISQLGIGGQGWRYGEGKRKKIMYKDGLPIISFTVDELKELRNGKNLYTMIRQKYYQLVDEVDDETADLPDEFHLEYNKRIQEYVGHFYKCGLLTTTEFESLQKKVEERYGSILED